MPSISHPWAFSRNDNRVEIYLFHFNGALILTGDVYGFHNYLNNNAVFIILPLLKPPWGVCLPLCPLCLATMVIVGVVVKVTVLSATLIAVNKSEILFRLSAARACGSTWWPQRVAKHNGLLFYSCRATSLVHPCVMVERGCRYHSTESSWHMFYTYILPKKTVLLSPWQWHFDYPDVSIAMSRVGISSKVPTTKPNCSKQSLSF